MSTDEVQSDLAADLHAVALVVLLWRNWRDVQGNSVVDFQLVIRALCFTVFQLFLIATYMLAIFDNNVVPKFMQAVAPIAVFFIFSTQPVWAFTLFVSTLTHI